MKLLFGVFTFPYQQVLAQLDKLKTTFLDKGSTENRNIDKLNHIGFKSCSSNAMEQSNNSTNRTTNIYTDI